MNLGVWFFGVFGFGFFCFLFFCFLFFYFFYFLFYLQAARKREVGLTGGLAEGSPPKFMILQKGAAENRYK
jgi:hypothetical protein